MRVSSRRILIAAILVLGMAGLIVAIVYFASSREPSYQGKTLSEWIAPFCRQTAKGLDAPGGPEHFQELEPVRNAVRQIGTNGLPFLIARLNHRESKLHRMARQLSEKQPIADLKLTDPNVSKIRAIRALAILGPGANPAIPSLKAQLTDADLSEHVIYTLSSTGAQGTRALVEQYTNVPAPLRIEIAARIIDPAYRWEEPISFVSVGGNFVSSRMEANQIQTNQIPAAILIEGFLQIGRDTRSPFQTPAIQRLGLCGAFASNAVPILLTILKDQKPYVRQAAIRALGQIKSQPDLVVPALSDLLKDSDPRIQTSAASALREFGYDMPTQSQVPRVMHPPRATQRDENRFY
jgi:HEAT repeats